MRIDDPNVVVDIAQKLTRRGFPEVDRLLDRELIVREAIDGFAVLDLRVHVADEVIVPKDIGIDVVATNNVARLLNVPAHRHVLRKVRGDITEQEPLLGKRAHIELRQGVEHLIVAQALRRRGHEHERPCRQIGLIDTFHRINAPANIDRRREDCMNVIARHDSSKARLEHTLQIAIFIKPLRRIALSEPTPY